MTLHVNIRVVDSGLAQNLRRLMWVRCGHFDVKLKMSVLVEPIIGTNRHLEIHQVIPTIVEIECYAFVAEIEFADICRRVLERSSTNMSTNMEGFEIVLRMF